MHRNFKARALRAFVLTSTALIAPALCLTAAHAQTKPDADNTAATLSEVVVTAQKRSENLQDVPVSIQALGAETLAEHQVAGLDDFTKFLPSVSIQSQGPGRSDVFFRGIATGINGPINSFLPTAGIYLDDTPVQVQGRTLDVHMYDIARVEALSGPQGTLFGASSLSGTLRIITNKPTVSGFSAAYEVQADKFGKGDFGGLAQGYANIPLSDRVALRVVGYYERQGGYIDNTPGSITYTFGGDPPNTSLTVNNDELVKKDFNPVETYGGRAALRIDLDENWTVTPQIVAQSLRTEGAFLYDPKLPDLSVHNYAPSNNADDWYQASLTIEGHTGLVDLVYAGSFLKRDVETEEDYAYYTVGYDKMPGYTYFPDSAGRPIDPSQHYGMTSNSKTQTHELRVSLPAGQRLGWTAGAFYQREDRHTVLNFYVPGLDATQSPMSFYRDNIYYVRSRAQTTDYAFFTEARYQLLPNLAVTAGIRAFTHMNETAGFSGNVFSAKRVGCPTPFTDQVAETCVNSSLKSSERGETHKLNVAWDVAPDKMLYATYSTGFRPGGANGIVGVRPYNSDQLNNYELGFKTTWFGRLRWNGSIYNDIWEGMQYRLVVPGNAGQGGYYNAGQARVRGVETDVQFVSQGLTLSGTMSYTEAKLTEDLCQLGPDLNPLPSCTPGPTTAAPAGTRLPYQPKFKASINARYEFPLGDYDAFVQGTLNTQSSTTSNLAPKENALLGNTPAFTTADFSMGARWDDKSIELFMLNVFDERGELAHNTICAITICSDSARYYPTKPRFFGVKFGQQF